MNQYGQKLTVTTVLCSFGVKAKSLGNFVNAQGQGKRETTTDERKATETSDHKVQQDAIRFWNQLDAEIDKADIAAVTKFSYLKKLVDSRTT